MDYFTEEGEMWDNEEGVADADMLNVEEVNALLPENSSSISDTGASRNLEDIGAMSVCLCV